MTPDDIKPGQHFIPRGSVYPGSVMREWSYVVQEVGKSSVKYEVWRPGHGVEVLECSIRNWMQRMRPAVLHKLDKEKA